MRFAILSPFPPCRQYQMNDNIGNSDKVLQILRDVSDFSAPPLSAGATTDYCIACAPNPYALSCSPPHISYA